jgi:hypothetical protein
MSTLAPALWGIPVVRSVTERGQLFANPATNQRVQNLESRAIERFDGVAWVTDSLGFTVNITDYGAVGDGSTDDTDAIQRAIDAAGDAGGGDVVVPPTANYWRITAALIPRDSVRVVGTGYASFIKNDRSTGYDSTRSNTSIFKLGGYESADPYWIFNETFYTAGDQAAGLSEITFQTPADAAHFATGDIVFIRTTAYEPFNAQKQVPRFAEINEVESVSTVDGTVALKYPLKQVYKDCLVAKSSGTMQDPDGNPIQVLKRFKAENMRFECAPNFAVGALSYGGCFECEFSNLWVTQSTLIIFLNAMARCRFSNIRGSYAGGFGELAYWSHDNEFDTIVAAYRRTSGTSAMNGFSTNEGASDNMFRNVRLNHGDAGTFPWTFGSGRNNHLVDSELRAAQLSVAYLAAIANPAVDYKPQGSSFENVTAVIEGNADGSGAPRFGFLIDSGGPYGGGNAVKNCKVIGRPLVAPVGFGRQDVRDGDGNGYGCSGNIAEGNTHLVSDVSGTQMVPANAAVVEYVNAAPNPTNETLIDPDWRPGDNIIRGNKMRLTQTPIDEVALGDVTAANGVETVLRDYVIPRYSVGTRTRWKVEIQGRVKNTMTHDVKTLALYFAGGSVFTFGFNNAETGTFRIEIDIGASVLSADNDSMNPTDWVVQAKHFVYRYWKNSTETRGVTSFTGANSNNSDYTFSIRYQIDNGAGTSDSITFDRLAIIPSGDEWSEVNWPLLFALDGGFPVIGY